MPTKVNLKPNEQISNCKGEIIQAVASGKTRMEKLEQAAEIFYGESQPMVPGNPSSEEVSARGDVLSSLLEITKRTPYEST